jgi:hypothetical protein
MRKLLSICDEFAKDFHILFNAGKSKCILFPSSNYGCINQSSTLPLFSVGDNLIEYVQSWRHHRHILRSDLRDDDYIEKRRIHTAKQINDVLCYFGKLDPLINLRLLYSYCSSLYGSQLWDSSYDILGSLYVSWRRDLKAVWKFPINTHSNILYSICVKRPIKIE